MAAVAAVAPQVLTEIAQESSHQAAFLFRQHHYLAYSRDVVLLTDFELLGKGALQRREILGAI